MRRRGMTLMELMVSVAILAVMILGFSNVLSQTQRVVNDSQRLMRANASIAAISQLMRSDFRSVSKIGFMRVKGDFVAFSSVGPSYSLTSNYRGLGKFVAYRIVRDAKLNPAAQDILCRQAFILKEDNPSPDGLTADVWTWDLATVQAMNLATLQGQITNIADPSRDPVVAVPPLTPTNFRNSWQVLLNGIAPMTSNPAVADFSIRYGQITVEYDAADPGKLKRKILMWTTTADTSWHRFNQNGWPDFVSLQFTVDEKAAQFEGLRAAGGSTSNPRVYEIVCGINR